MIGGDIEMIVKVNFLPNKCGHLNSAIFYGVTDIKWAKKSLTIVLECGNKSIIDKNVFSSITIDFYK